LRISLSTDLIFKYLEIYKKNVNPGSEEEIWIRVKIKNKY
jgi:hypothetical protein